MNFSEIGGPGNKPQVVKLSSFRYTFGEFLTKHGACCAIHNIYCWYRFSLPSTTTDVTICSKRSQRSTPWDCKKVWLGRPAVVAMCALPRRRLMTKIVLGASAAASYIMPAFSLPMQADQDSDAIRYRKLDSGVKLQDIIEGSGQEAQEGDLVEFNYVCRRSNGYFVHSTVDQFSGESTPVKLSLDAKEMIRGLKDVLVGMKSGGKRRALIPPSVGYTSENLKPIPEEFGPRRSLLSHANEPLIFEVQLLRVLG